jgi:hypothetical protein
MLRGFTLTLVACAGLVAVHPARAAFSLSKTFGDHMASAGERVEGVVVVERALWSVVISQPSCHVDEVLLPPTATQVPNTPPTHAFAQASA